MGILLDEELMVTAVWKQASPSLPKARSRRGTVGVGKGSGVAEMKRTNLERFIEQDKQAGVRKAKVMRIKGPVLHPIPSLVSMADACGSRVERWLHHRT